MMSEVGSTEDDFEAMSVWNLSLRRTLRELPMPLRRIILKEQADNIMLRKRVEELEAENKRLCHLNDIDVKEVEEIEKEMDVNEFLNPKEEA